MGSCTRASTAKNSPSRTWPVMTTTDTEPKDHEAAATPPSARPLPIEIWTDSRRAIKAVGIDSLLFLSILCALLLGYAGLHSLAAMGYPPERVARMEALHYWGYLTCQGLFLIDLVWKLVLSLFGGREEK